MFAWFLYKMSVYYGETWYDNIFWLKSNEKIMVSYYRQKFELNISLTNFSEIF